MIKLEHFLHATRSQHADAQVSVTSDRTSATTRTGRLVRWIGRLRTGRNRETANRFLSALRSRYGSEIAHIVTSSDDVKSALKRGTPLKARHVAASIDHADRLSTDFRRANARIAASFGKPINRTGPTRLQVKIRHEAARMPLGWGSRGVASLVDEDHVARRLQQQLTALGDGDRRLVTTEDANRVLDTVVRNAVNATYTFARAGAAEKLSFREPGSMAAQALADAARERDLPLQTERLEPGVVNGLTREVQEALAKLDAPSLVDEAKLRPIAERTATAFVARRAEAVQAVDSLPLDGDTKAALREQVLHDGTAPALVPHMGAALVAVGDDVSRLGERLEPEQVRSALTHVHAAVTEAIRNSDVEVDVDNQNAVYGQFWRFLLAATDRNGLEATADRFEPGAPLREFSEGVGWVKRRFPMTSEGARVTDYNAQGEIEIRGKPMSLVSEYVTLTENLANVLRDRVGRPAEIDDPPSLDVLSPGAINMLRETGMPLPEQFD
ncbi:MAG: hypothetical protein F4X99_09785 [Gammaproteobacteria bacterium]|nr:hypothetical protein [Gammaproteobacteria bacterium]